MNVSTQLTLKFRPGLRLTDRAFEKLCAANPELRLERTARGELIVMAPAGSESGHRNLNLAGQLWTWIRTSQLGIGFDSSAGFRLPNGATRSPDLAWMPLERWDALPREDRETFAHVCPDFVVELRSRSDEKKDLRAKMREYLAQGVRLGWLIDPKEGSVEIYRPDRAVEVLERPSTLSGEDVLPGFVLELKGILFD